MTNRDRKQPKRHRRRKRAVRGPGVVFVLLACILAAAAIIAAMTVFFKIETIIVKGDTDYTAEEIIEASGLKKGQNMYFFNKFTAIKQIFDKCVNLEEISIRRSLPSTVIITVTPSQPAAAVSDGTSWYIIDRLGKVLEITDREGVVSFASIDGALVKPSEVGKTVEFFDEEVQKPCFLVLNSLLDNDILNKTESIDMSKPYEISFRYEGRFTVVLGSADEMERKLEFLSAAVDKLDRDAEGTIDVSDTEKAVFLPD